MYEQAFNLNQRPFTSTPFVRHFFPAEAIQTALSQSRSCIERATGPAIVVGGAGMGKSLLLATLAETYQSKFRVVNLSCARLDERLDLLQSILFELDQPYRDMTEGEMRLTLLDYLKPGDDCPSGIVLLVDDAHQLSVGLLDEIRLITNFVCDGQPRVHLVLAGKQKLEESLTDSRLESLNQRITARCYLSNLNRDETRAYVITHIDRAGGDGASMFSIEGLDAIHDSSEGCPRIINQIASHSLILAASNGQTQIDAATVHQAWADVQCIPNAFPLPSNDTPTSGVSQFSDEHSENGIDQEGSTTSIRSQQSDDWTVIEFGELDAEEKQNIASIGDAEFDVEEPVASAEIPDDDSVDAPEKAPEIMPEIGLVVEEATETQAQTVSFDELPSDSHDEHTDVDEVRLEEDYQLAPLDRTTERPTLPTVANESVGATDELAIDEEVVDPFAEVFDQEESIAEQYSPMVAEQNICSLTVTKDQLRLLEPLDESQCNPANGVRFETYDYPGLTTRPNEPVSSHIGAVENDVPDSSPSQPASSHSPESDAHSFPSKSMNETIELQQRLAKTQFQSAIESMGEKDSPFRYDGQPGDPSHVVVSVMDDLRLTSEEMQQLDTVEEAVDRIEAASLEQPYAEEILESAKGQHSNPDASLALPNFDSGPRETLEKTEGELLLEKIREMQQAVVDNEAESLEPGVESPQTISIEYPVTQHETYRETKVADSDPTDDREMLIVSRTEQKDPTPEDVSTEEQLLDMPSTGNAARMDYQKLFDQLRKKE